VTGPMTPAVFLSNLAHAAAFHRLRVPSDPFDAEARFCRVPLLQHASIEATGGSPFRWKCPSGLPVTRINGDIDSKGFLARLRVVCGDLGQEGDQGPALEGPSFGGTTFDSSFGVACPSRTWAAGVYGTTGGFVRSLGLTCADAEGHRFRSSRGGWEIGSAFGLSCDEGSVLVGIEGRSGDLVDAAGIVCGRVSP